MTVQKTSIKPRTPLMIDALLFVLFTMVVISKLFEALLPRPFGHFRFMLHILHGVSGIGMCGVVAYHLFLHWSWIKVQFRHLIGGQS
jgi:hypothetical protein